VQAKALEPADKTATAMTSASTCLNKRFIFHKTSQK
jgi:hypothetical protein